MALERSNMTDTPEDSNTLPDHIDVLIVGAGLSGVSAAYHLKTYCPDKTYAILEARDAMGGTWDLFRYPGIRSDSDMFTLGYSFKPWKDPKAIADGPSILKYIKETAEEYGIDKEVRYGCKVARARWSSEDGLWTVEADTPQGPHTLTCQYMYLCTGYYDYDEGYMPGWPGMERFQGQTVHPQFWPEDLSYDGKKVVIVGSGATAITLAPTMAEKAGHVTMLQRSPTYVVSRPSQDAFANFVRRWFPERIAYSLARAKAIRLSAFFYNLARRKPDGVKLELIRLIREELGPDYDVERHFFPRYNPWDQRVCLVPDGDLFKSIREGKADVVTDTIETFTEKGIKLNSGKELEADIIVTATGLKLKAAGGIDVSVDGKAINWADTMLYKGMMYSGVPNLASAMGYTNASWTLKCDMGAEYFCRVINYIDENGYVASTPVRNDPSVKEEPALGLKSGYIMRAYDSTPKQGSKAPWRLDQNYFKDRKTYRHSPLDDGVLSFLKKTQKIKPESSGFEKAAE